jgi:hypothetical protein
LLFGESAARSPQLIALSMQLRAVKWYHLRNRISVVQVCFVYINFSQKSI